MVKRLLLLDVALIALLVLGGMKLRQEWKAFWPEHDVAALRPKPQAFPSLASAAPAGSPGSEDWTGIPSRNPFSFDRTDIDVVAPKAPVAAAAPSGPRPVLYGTVFLDRQQRFAMVAPGPAGRNYKPMKVGETLDGWTIVELEPKLMVVESNGVRQTVIMNDPTLQIPRETARTAAVAPSVTIIQNVPQAAASAAQGGTVPTSTAPPTSSSEIKNAFDLFGGTRR